MVSIAAVLYLVPLAAVVTLLVVVYTRGTVSRARVERFARRQRLRVTVDNGHQVIRYLATTRRWRVAGFFFGLAMSQVGAAEQNYFVANVAVIFLGWFLGAMIAEGRVMPLGQGSVRTASLQPRRPEHYVRRFAWALLPISAAVSVLVAIGTAIADLAGRADPDWQRAGGLAGGAVVLAAMIRYYEHVVLQRPQPGAAPDVIEADDAIRSRSLHVLSGGGAAMVLLLVLNQVEAIHPVGPISHQFDDLGIGIGPLLVALLGWIVGTSIWPPPGVRSRRRAA